MPNVQQLEISWPAGNTDMNRVDLVNRLCQVVGISRSNNNYGYFTRRELIHLLGWVCAGKNKKE